MAARRCFLKQQQRDDGGGVAAFSVYSTQRNIGCLNISLGGEIFIDGADHFKENKFTAARTLFCFD
jgi:hypothetical protein